jgi:AmmeMemoRadiSam system protein B
MTEEYPRLRSVEVFAVVHEGRRLMALRDPSGYATGVLLLPPELSEMVALFDGQHSLLDIQAELTRRRGTLVLRSEIEEVVATLDAQGFLDSPAFAARRAAVDAAFQASPRRPAAHAGSAYPADPDELRRTMDGFFTAPEGPGPVRPSSDGGIPVRGIIAPHIDYHRGGPAYAWAYRDLAERSDADLFVILGTCHAGMEEPFALTLKDYETPFGPAPVDRELVERLAARAGPACLASELAHRAEHSIEFQVVFLRYLFAGRREFTILPILASFAHEALARGRDVEDDPRVSRFLQALGETLEASRRRAVLIAGADLAHVGPRFGDPAPVTPLERAQIAREDREMLGAVEAADARAFYEAVSRDGDRRRICGLSPIYAFLRALGRRPGTLRYYGQWPDPQGLVSFASLVFE